MSDISAQSDSLFDWTAHPAGEDMGRAGWAVVAIIALSAGVYLLTEGLGMGVGGRLMASGGGGLVLILALNRFFFVSRFSIDGKGITARYPLKRMNLQWKNLRRFVHDARGGYLSTRGRRSRMDAFSGMHVLFGDCGETVISLIQKSLREKEGGA